MKIVDHFPRLELDLQFLLCRVDTDDLANISVKDLFVVIVLVLDDLVPEPKLPAEPLHRRFGVTQRVQPSLQKSVHRSGAQVATVHGTEDLDIENWVKPQLTGNAFFY